MAKGKRQINLATNTVTTIAPAPVTADQAEAALRGDATTQPNATSETSDVETKENNTMADAHAPATDMPTDNISYAAEQQGNSTLPDNTPDAQAPDTTTDNNGANEVDEDLLINQKSSPKDRRDYYMKEARKAGRDFASGMASQLTLAEKILEGAVNGSLTYAEYPDGHKQDDALDMYKAFRMPKKDSPPVDINSGTFNNNVAKYRAMVYLGMNHRTDAQEWFGSVVDTYNAKSIEPDIKKSMKNFNGTFEAAVDVVREQLSRDSKAPNGVADLMDDDEIFDAMLKKDRISDDDAVTMLIEAYKKLNLARDGKATKTGKGNFEGLKQPRLATIIEELADFAKTELDPKGSASFSAGTVKQKRTRRVITAPQANGAVPADANTAPVHTGHTETDEWLANEPSTELTDEEREAQEQADQE